MIKIKFQDLNVDPDIDLDHDLDLDLDLDTLLTQVTSEGQRPRSNPRNFEVEYLKNGRYEIERKCQQKTLMPNDSKLFHSHLVTRDLIEFFVLFHLSFNRKQSMYCTVGYAV